MDNEVNRALAHWRLRMWVFAARAHQTLGWVGLFGIALVGFGVATAVSAWQLGREDSRDLPTPSVAAQPKDITAMSVRGEQDDPALQFPKIEQVPALLQRIERAALAHGLGWPQAEYRSVPASSDLPGAIEIHCALKGPYPSVRRFISAVLRDLPTSTLRELNISRPGSEVPDVEARMTIAVLLADVESAHPSATPGPGSER